uniref:Uncharacterized protein n=1 Tax=Daucus carota subsp. sativus TaxID=79200 RepID=A0A166DVG9_DAUCS
MQMQCIVNCYYSSPCRFYLKLVACDVLSSALGGKQSSADDTSGFHITINTP